jgi:hypothetical protein
VIELCSLYLQGEQSCIKLKNKALLVFTVALLQLQWAVLAFIKCLSDCVVLGISWCYKRPVTSTSSAIDMQINDIVLNLAKVQGKG